MNDCIFKLHIIKNNSDYEDVAFKSDLLNLNYKFASAYYIHHPGLKQFLRFPDDQEESANKRIVFRHFLGIILAKLKLLKRDHDVFFPIDMDEDFTSVLKCSMDADEQFFIQFGVVDTEGVGIEITTLDPIGEITKHFKAQTAKVTCDKEAFEIAISENLILLNQEAVTFTVDTTINQEQ